MGVNYEIPHYAILCIMLLLLNISYDATNFLNNLQKPEFLERTTTPTNLQNLSPYGEARKI
jgi:hypothetical protein